MNEIKVQFFARLREQIGQDAVVVRWSKTNSISELISSIESELGAEAADLLRGNDILVAVNQTMVERDAEVKCGDEVAFLPPVTGG